MTDKNQGYRKINAVAHQARTTNVSAPALCRHMAYWIPESYRPSDNSDAPKFLHLEELDNFIANVLRIFDPSNISVHPERPFELNNIKPNNGSRVVLFARVVSFDEARLGRCGTPLSPSAIEREMLSSENRTVRIRISDPEATHKIRIQSYTEYFTITLTSEFKTGSEPDCAFWRNQVLLSRLLNNKATTKPTVLRDSPSHPQNLNRYFYYEYWKDFIGEILSRAKIKNAPSDIFGDIFADFRGLVISDETIESLPYIVEQENSVDPEWGRKISHDLLGFVVTGGNYECTVSYMLHRRALYMTALGPTEPDSSVENRVPVEYVLCVQQRSSAFTEKNTKIVNRWQLGRLIERIHHLGTVRLAALRDLDRIQICGTRIKKLDVILKAARKSLYAYYDDPDQIDKLTIRRIKDLHYEFDAISKFTEDADDGVQNPLDLSYRVERSRYYSQQFKVGVASLHLENLEGFQQYDHFVERRLGATFDYIDRVGIRYERAGSAVAAVDQSYLAISADKTEKEIASIGSSISRLQAKIAHVQVYGEIFLLGILIPYYLIGTIQHVLGEENLLSQAIAIVVTSLFASISIFKIPVFESEKSSRSAIVGEPNLRIKYRHGILLILVRSPEFWARKIKIEIDDSSDNVKSIGKPIKVLQSSLKLVSGFVVSLGPIQVTFLLSGVLLFLYCLSKLSIFH